MALLEIPNEVLLLIAENLSVKDLSRFLSTNRHLSCLLTPRLHNLALQDVYGYTALQWAVRRGLASLAELLISKGAELYRTHRYPRSPLSMAIFSDSSSDVFCVLIKHGAQFSPSDIFPTMLHAAVEHRATRVARVLLELGAATDMTRTNSSGMTPVHLAARSGYFHTMEVLLGAGSDISLQTRDGNTVLHEAVYGGRGMVDYLLGGWGAARIIDVQNNEGDTALHLAVRYRPGWGIWELLLQNGASSTVVNARGEVPFEGFRDTKKCN